MKQFAASGSCFDKPLYVHGKISTDGLTFMSNEFNGTMDSQKFWEDLKAYANTIKRFVYLMY